MRTNKTAATLVALLLMSGPALALDYGPVSIHGIFSQGYIDSTHNNYIEDSEGGTTAFREYGVNAMWKTPVDKLRVGAQVFGREFGAVGNDSPYLDWGYLDYRATDWIGIRLGRVKVPLGLYNETRDIDALRTEILQPQGVYIEMQREAYKSADAAVLYGEVPLKKAGSLSYQIQYGYLVMDVNNGDMARILKSGGITPDDYDVDPGTTVALQWETPLNGLRFGSTYSWLSYVMDTDMSLSAGMLTGGAAGLGAGGPDSGGGKPPAFMNLMTGVTSVPLSINVHDQTTWTMSAEYVIGNLTLASEYILMKIRSDMSNPLITPVSYDSDYEGWYVKGSYRFCKWFEAAASYSSLAGEDPTSSFQPFAMTKYDDTAISARFDITDNIILKVEQHFIEGGLGIFGTENPDGIDGTMSMTLAKVSAYF